MTEDTKALSQFKSLKIIYVAVVASTVMFSLAVLAITYVQLMENQPSETSLGNLSYLALITVALSIPLSLFIYKSQLKSVRGKKLDLSGKLKQYATAMITQAAVIEGSVILTCVAVLIEGQPIILFSIPIVLFMLFLNRPTLFRLKNDLQLSREELEILTP